MVTILIRRRSVDKKLFVFDVETTGTKPHYHEIHQLSGLIVVNGAIVDEFDYHAKPDHVDRIDPKALEVCNVSADDFLFSMPQKELHNRVLMKLGQHCDKFNHEDKFSMAGHNAAVFDAQFLRYLFSNNNDKYIGSWFNGSVIDTLQIARFMSYCGVISPENCKLETLCNYFGIKLDYGHDAMFDVKATWEIIQVFEGMAKCIEFGGKVERQQHDDCAGSQRVPAQAKAKA